MSGKPMTEAESIALTTGILNDAFKRHPDLMERWVVMLDGVTNQKERPRIMWAGLAETIRQRYPNAEADREVDAAIAMESTKSVQNSPSAENQQ